MKEKSVVFVNDGLDRSTRVAHRTSVPGLGPKVVGPKSMLFFQ